MAVEKCMIGMYVRYQDWALEIIWAQSNAPHM